MNNHNPYNNLSACVKIARSDNMSKGITHLINSQVMEEKDTVGVDQFSRIPQETIHNIFSRLPMKSFVQTSLLSRKWRQHNWTLNPNFDFELSSLTTADIVPLINNRIAAYKGPQIHTFRVFGISHEDISKEIVKWVNFAVAKHVKVLYIDVCMDRVRDDGNIYFDVPASLFSCDSIESLTLDKCVCSPPPLGFKGFPSLKTLSLRNIRISAETVAEVLSKSPLLEKFWLYEPESISFLKICAPTPRLAYISVRGGPAKRIEIWAPDLQFLDLNGNLETFHVFAPRLVRAQFPTLFAVDRGSGGALRDWASSVAKISNVTVLNANMHFLMLLYADCYMNGRNPLVKFQNLMSFHVIGGLDETYGVSALVNFFRDCPRIKSVIIEPRTPVFGGNWVCERMRMERVRPIIVTDEGGEGSEADAEGFSDYNDLVHLKTIAIRGFTGSQGEMKLLKFLLEKAVVLDILSLEWKACCHSPDVVKELAKASPHTEIREHHLEEIRIGDYC